ncbi:MAG: MFS transporter [Chloroflexi bacterium]|nr:MFS transporter [Chloroflexota bacterium]
MKTRIKSYINQIKLTTNQTSSRIKTRSQRIFYGWWLCAIGFVINAIGIGVHFYGLSTFFNPMIEEFGWSRTVMSGAYSLSRLEGGITGPLDGWLVDRFGARKMLFIGTVLASAGYIALSFVHTPFWFYIVVGTLMAEGFTLGFQHAINAAIAKWFIKMRSRALSIVAAGNGVGGAIFVPVIAWAIVQFGWRATAVYIGIGLLICVIPLSFIVRSTPEEMGLKPDGIRDSLLSQKPADKEAPSKIITGPVPEDINLSVKEALKTKAFWIYSGSMMLRSCILSSIVVHQIPHLTDIGIPYQTAATVLGLMVLMSIPSRLISGWLGDRYSKKNLVFLMCIMQGLGVFIFIHATTTAMLYLFVIVYGSGYGGMIPLSTALRGDLFGRKNFATIGGTVMLFTMIGTVSAPVLAGYLYDTTHSYSIAFYIFMVMIILSGLLFLALPRTAKD